MLYIALFLYVIVMIGVMYFFFGSFISLIFGNGVPYVPTYNDDIALLKNTLKLDKGKTLIDLGCGDGKVLRCLEKNFNLEKLDGYDINPYAISLGKLLIRIGKFKTINLFKKDFLQAPIGEYDYIYTYLLTNLMEKIEDRVFNDMKSDAIIISNSFQFKNHKPFKIIKNKKGKDRLFFYKK